MCGFLQRRKDRKERMLNETIEPISPTRRFNAENANSFLSAMICLPFVINAFAAETGHRTVIYDNRTTEVAPPPATLSTDELWVTLRI